MLPAGLYRRIDRGDRLFAAPLRRIAPIRKRSSALLATQYCSVWHPAQFYGRSHECRGRFTFLTGLWWKEILPLGTPLLFDVGIYLAIIGGVMSMLLRVKEELD